MMLNVRFRYSDVAISLRWAALIAVIPILLTSCLGGKVADQSVALSEEGWFIADSVIFGVDVADTTKPVDFYLNIRNETDYRYANLILFLDSYFPDGRHSRDTLECFLANKEGEWTGSGIGSSKENSLLVKKNVLFPLSGHYRFVFTQAMRDDPLKGITDIGITIARTSQ